MVMRLAAQMPADVDAATAPSAGESQLALPPLPSRDSPKVERDGAIQRTSLEIPAVTPPQAVDALSVTPAPEPDIADLVDAPLESDHRWEVLEVHKGDSLSTLFSRAGLSASDLHYLLQADEESALRRIHPGDEILIQTDDSRRLTALRYKLREDTTLTAERSEQKFNITLESTPPDVEIREAYGTISSSLFIAGRDAGLDDRLIMELAGIFAWDIDFALDIRASDRFSVLYEALYRDGEYVRSGNILAAEFVNRGRSFRALRHVTEDGHASYYSPDGRSMRKAFLRSPVDFHRISSHFNPDRLHPVLGTNRPHRGVDYAASTGTPVRAAGDGRIVHLGRHGGYGNTIIIKHGSRYSTLYAHLSRYARGLSSGQRVRQGQIIGHVGMSGLATGPHLHYEFLVDGRHRDPVRVKLPDAEPLPEQHLADFQAQSAALLSRLDALQPTRMALRDE